MPKTTCYSAFIVGLANDKGEIATGEFLSVSKEKAEAFYMAANNPDLTLKRIQVKVQE